jgi:hypothetical protein
MQVGSSPLPQLYELDDQYKNEKRPADKQISDETYMEKAIECANAKRGAEAAAFVKVIKDQGKRDAITLKVFDIFGKLDQSSPEAYDATKGFVWGITSVPPVK